MRAIWAVIAFLHERRKIRRVIAALEIEAARLRLDRDNRNIARYVDSLKKYLEDA